jgi:hypothetical protein
MSERDQLFWASHGILTRLFHVLRAEMTEDQRQQIDDAVVNSQLDFVLSLGPAPSGMVAILDRHGVHARVTFDMQSDGKALDVYIVQTPLRFTPSEALQEGDRYAVPSLEVNHS